MNDSKGRGSSKNGALFLENLALEANWPGPLKKPAAKKFVNEFVASRRVSELADGFKEMSTLRNMSNWVEKERFGLPEYLLRACPASLREGRRLKTKFRLGCHDLQDSFRELPEFSAPFVGHNRFERGKAGTIGR